MKAVISTGYGSPDVLQLQELTTPKPKANEVLIIIKAVAITSGDCRLRSFTVPPLFWFAGRLGLGFRRLRQPVLGSAFSGIVEAIGKNVTMFKEGDLVVGSKGHEMGAYAEYLCIAEKNTLVIKPKKLNFADAAAVPFGALTALFFLQKAAIKSGDKVLINGASGAVGSFAIQLAKYFGAEVTAVCSSKNVKLVKSLGADRVIDYNKQSIYDNSQKYDIFFDVVGLTKFSLCRKLIKSGGYYLHSVMVLAGLKTFWYSLTTDIHVVGGTFNSKAEDLKFLIKLIAEGKVLAVVDKIYPLKKIVEAHRYVEGGQKKGIVVIEI